MGGYEFLISSFGEGEMKLLKQRRKESALKSYMAYEHPYHAMLEETKEKKRKKDKQTNKQFSR